MLQDRGGSMEMESAFAAFGDREVLEDLGLKRRTEPLGIPDAIIFGCSFELRQRGDAEVLIEPQHLLWPQSRDGQQLQYSGRGLLSQPFEGRVRAGAMELGYK